MIIFINPTDSSIYRCSSFEGLKTYLFTWNNTISEGRSIHEYSLKLMQNGDVICVWKTEILLSGSDDSVRKNPIVYVASNNYIPVLVDFGGDIKPSGWFANVGALELDGNLLFCEYTRPSVQRAIIWKVSYPYQNKTNWVNKKEIILSGNNVTGLKHWHCIQRDPYTGVIYATTGDDNTGAYVYYSVDDGNTFNILYGPSEKLCRLVNYIFTENWIYWSSDTSIYEFHFFFKAPRTSGILDHQNITEILQFPNIANLATYNSVFVESINCILFLERFDSNGSSLLLRVYDFNDNQLKTIDTLTSVIGSSSFGFRLNYVDIYPTGNSVYCGFSETLNLYSNYANNISKAGNRDASIIHRRNNLIITLQRDGSNIIPTYSSQTN